METASIRRTGSTDRLAELVRGKLGERRFYSLVAAVREHQSRARSGLATRPHDEALYARLRQICGEL